MLTPSSTARTAPGPKRRGQRQQHQHGGQVVADVGQDRGQRRRRQQRGQRGAAGQQRRERPAEPVLCHRLDYYPQGQDEQQEGQVSGAQQAARRHRAAGQRPRRQHRRAGACRPGGIDARRRRDGEPGQRQRHHDQRDHRQRGRYRRRRH